MQSTSIAQFHIEKKRLGGLALVAGIAAGLGMVATSARAGTLPITLNQMLNDSSPDVLVDPYTVTPNGNDYPIAGMNSSSSMTLITINTGPDAGTYAGTISGEVDLDGGGNILSGNLTETAYLSGIHSPATTVFTSTDPVAFGLNPSANVGYWFEFIGSSIFLTGQPTALGGLVTGEGDIKEYAAPVPAPDVAESGLILMLGVAGWGGYRRLRSLKA